ncbi:MAG: hypothetical protein PT934_06995 [Peptoniphilaceae bacterium]|uniref:hypothetical protein n=1 Tax=Parvimonas sp. TaxID=1944660 RepID=UPI0025CE0E9B|nr:hypothetical protein [Parvimonas sp.]MCI5997416.1 hypothetical protein [Parvimonas sp.]MDD7765497.1 hypothetical protein [Peptoniphilaceae bacterium]MDY3051038.1 hypothetical protein [Parvimonas sp.]
MAIRKRNEDKIREDKAKIMMSSLTIIMTGTLVVYFFYAVLNSKFLINFSIDALVGAVALVILIGNFKLKYKVLKDYSDLNYFKFIDVLSFSVCVFIKIAFKIPFDFSLFILLLAYYLTKTKFDKIV